MNSKTGKRLLYEEVSYLKSGSDVDQNAVNDVELFKELVQQFKDLGFTNDEQLAVWRVVAAVLHLGEISFDESTFDENGKPCTVVNKDRMAIVSRLLGISNVDDLICEIVNKPPAPGMTVRAPYRKMECIDSRDSLAKSLFNSLFCWLVKRMNLTILPEYILEGNLEVFF